MPLLSSSAATGSRQRPDAASAIASGSIARRCSIAHGSGRERFSRSVVAAPTVPIPSPGYVATWRANSATISSCDVTPAPDVSSAQASPRTGEVVSSSPSTPASVALQVGEVAAHDALRVREVVLVLAAPRARRAAR